MNHLNISTVHQGKYRTYLSTTKSLLGCGGMRFRTYWKTSVCLSSTSHTLHCSRSTSHRWRSRSTRFRTTDGGASTSTETRQRRNGFPSPTCRRAGHFDQWFSDSVNQYLSLIWRPKMCDSVDGWINAWPHYKYPNKWVIQWITALYWRLK